MRIDEEAVVRAQRDEVWRVLADPSCYPTFMAGVTRWEPRDLGAAGVGARYDVRMQVGSAQVGSLIEVVEFDPPGDLAWTSVTGVDQRGRWRLRERRGRETVVTLRLSYQTPGGLIALIVDRIAAPMLRANMRRSLDRLRGLVEGNGLPLREGTRRLV